MKSEVSPMWLTYFMVRWEDVKQYDSEQKCVDCGLPMKKTETCTDPGGLSFVGYVCHPDKRVTWLKEG